MRNVSENTGQCENKHEKKNNIGSTVLHKTEDGMGILKECYLFLGDRNSNFHAGLYDKNKTSCFD